MTVWQRAATAEAMDERLVAQLAQIAPTKTDEPLARHTTFGIGGPADVFVTVRDATELARVVMTAREFEAPIFILGSGSNILVGDRGIRGVVIDNEAKAWRVEPLQLDPGSPATLPDRARDAAPDDRFVVWAESGVPFAALARALARDGYAGIEWACGIPGTLGGAIVYNAGAYNGSLSDVLLTATVLNGNNGTREMTREQLGFGYRTSALLRGECGGCVVLTVELVVVRGDAAALQRRVADLDRQRLAAQPRGRNSGSTFKNPPGDHAWRLIDAVGLRGYRIGNARISDRHANFFENLGGARAADVAALMREAQRRVRERFGVELESEVELVGEGFE